MESELRVVSGFMSPIMFTGIICISSGLFAYRNGYHQRWCLCQILSSPCAQALEVCHP